MFDNKIKKRLKSGDAVIGSFITCNSPDLIEIMGLAGFDFIVIDTEHGPLSIETTVDLIRAAELRGLTPITRVTNTMESTILRTLDVGAHGIQVPQVYNSTIARQIVKSSKYFPIGNRGLAMPRSSDYGIHPPIDYFKHTNKETMIVLHCENRESLDNLEEIAQIPEIDVIFLGPFDMSQSLGIPGQVHHPLIKDAAEKVVDICRKNNIAPGIFVSSGEEARNKIQSGFQYITIGMDTSLFYQACLKEIKSIKK